MVTEHEFEKWLGEHVARFPGLHAWFQKLAESGGIKAGAISRAWFDDHLRYVTFDAALAATKVMSTEEEFQPRGYEKHPIVLRRIIRDRQLQKMTVPLHERCSCDDGDVIVFARESLAGIRRLEKGLPVDDHETVAVRCRCRRGEERNKNAVHPLEFFDSAKHVRVKDEPWRLSGSSRKDYDARIAKMKEAREKGRQLGSMLR